MALEDRIRLPTLNLIHRRPRLLNMLTEFVTVNKRLITIYAPGGYGKSILLADFAQTTDLPVCWCSLEPADRDPTSFLTLLVYSITDRFHDIESDKLFKLVERGDTQASIHRIGEILADVGPHLIIVDDYHKAISAGMTLALNRLLQQLPDTTTMIVAARGDMDLETSQIIDLLISERAAGLSEEELSFTGDEIQRVMLKRFGRRLDLEAANEIAQATDGNIAQILLTGHVAHAERIIGSLRQRLGEDQQVIYGYLAEEVFGKQSPQLQRFLLHTSVLPEMTVELCNDLLEITEAQAILDEIVRKDLFIARIGAGFRYHDLFAEFLRGKLAEDQATYRQVSIRAADLLVAQARFEEAVNLYLSVQAWTEAANLLEVQGTFFYDTGRALTLNQWLAEISEQELTQHPRLLLLQGQILLFDLSDPKPAMSLFKQAEEQFCQHNDPIGAAEAQVWRSVGLRLMGQATEALALAIHSLRQLEDLNASDRVVAWAIEKRGNAHRTAGNLEEALIDFRRALELFESLGDTYNEGVCHQNIGVVLGTQGNISGADHHFRQAIRIWEGLGNATDLANTLNSLGVSLLLIGRYDEALRHFGDSVDIALQTGATRRAAFAQAGIGDVYLETQAYEQAVEAYAISIEFAREASVRTMQVYNLARVGECFYYQQNLARALELAGQAREIATETGLVLEKGLAIFLQAKIYARQAEYRTSFALFAAAVSCLTGNDVLAEAKARLWWGYSLLLDLRASAAFEQLQEVIRLTLAMGELIQGLGSTILETRQLLLHFLHQSEIPAGTRDSIKLLLAQSPQLIEISEPNLQVFALGVPTLVVAGELRQFSQRGKARILPEFLLYLILEGQGNGCRWSEVGTAMWPEVRQNKVSSSFHQNIKRLRDVIFETPDYVIVRDDYYLINPDYIEWCDVLAFDKLFEQLVVASLEDSLSLQLELISIYRGEFLAGFELGEWGSLYRARYETRFLQVVSLAAEQLLEQGDPRTALTAIDKGLAQDYFREDLHRSAFKAYAQLGWYDQLAAYYAGLRKTFEQELGVPPEPETEQLYQELIAKKT